MSEGYRTETNSTKQSGKKFYGLVVAVMLVALVAQYLAAPLAQAYPPVRGAMLAQVLQVLLSISMVWQPVPAIFHASLPHLVITTLYWVQVTLLIRRIAICLRNRTIVVPRALFGGWIALLILGLLSWVIGTATFLSPLLLNALHLSGLAWTMQVANALLTSALYIPAANVFGIAFFAVEILSLKYDGLFVPMRTVTSPDGGTGDSMSAPPSARSDMKDESNGVFMRRVSRIGLTLGLALVLVPPVWSVFPTGLVHDHLCKTSAGEHVYEKVRATSFLFVGEGASDDGLHLWQALEDLADRHVDFLEILKVPENHHQANAFGSMFGTHDPKGTVFRISIGPAGAPNCLRRHRYYGMRETLQPDECLQYLAVEKAVSRYHVEAVYNQQATWLTPSLRSDGARVIDSERNLTLGEDLIFANTSRLAFFVLGEKRMECPARYGRKPAGLYRKVLLGAG